MRKTIRVIYNNNIETREFKTRQLSHLESQLKFPHKVERPKKGKGSYSRKRKYKENNFY